MRSIPLTSLFLVACSALGVGSKSDALNYAQVQSLRKGMPMSEVVRQFGEPESRREFDDGSVALAYRAENAGGKVQELRIAFDESGLLRWTLAARK